MQHATCHCRGSHTVDSMSSVGGEGTVLGIQSASHSSDSLCDQHRNRSKQPGFSLLVVKCIFISRESGGYDLGGVYLPNLVKSSLACQVIVGSRVVSLVTGVT